MAVYAITYDLHQPSREYEDLHDAIEDLGAWWHHVESTWLVDTDGPSSDIRDELKQYLDSNDELLVVKLSGGWATTNINESGTDWLHEHM